MRAISSVIACVHDIGRFLEKTLSLIEELLKCICYLNGTELVALDRMCLQKCKDYFEIAKDPEAVIKSTREIQRRSDVWLEMRKSAMVTGSTIYGEIGLDGLAKQKEHFEKVICGLPEREKSDKTKEFLQYGTDNEQNATATIGRVLPLLFQNMLCFEEGYVEIGTSNGKRFMIVSPDGSVRSAHDPQSRVAGIELKCPVFDILREVPHRCVTVSFRN